MSLLSKFRLNLAVIPQWQTGWCGALVLLCAAYAPAQDSNSTPSPAASVAHVPKADETNVSLLTATNQTVQAAWQFFTGTNAATAEKKTAPDPGKIFQARLEIARYYRLARRYADAAKAYVSILQSDAPAAVQRTAMLELAQTARDQNELARAQQIYAQCIARWPKDPDVPQTLLRQGQVYRQMGLPDLAISKFYAVMASSLVLRPDHLDYYQKLVLRAQNEIAETQFEQGKWAEAANSFSKLLNLDSPPDNRSALQYKYIRCLVALGRRDEVIAQARDFLGSYTNALERPEVRFLYATCLKREGRDAEALKQVLALLKEEHSTADRDPEMLAYWQRRAGNEIANQFYQEGDFMKALDIYVRLAALDKSPEWQLPAWYQIGLIFERLNQPAKAIEYYGDITRRTKEVTTNAAPSLRAVLEMANWRKNFLTWQLKAEATNLKFHATEFSANATNAPALQAQSSL